MKIKLYPSLVAARQQAGKELWLLKLIVKKHKESK